MFILEYYYRFFIVTSLTIVSDGQLNNESSRETVLRVSRHNFRRIVKIEEKEKNCSNYQDINSTST